MLGALVACSDSSEELVSPDMEEKETRTDAGTPAYYWAGGEKQTISLTDKKSYILFHSSNQETIIAKLEKQGIYISENEIFESGIYEKGMEETNDATSYFEECKWAGINLSCQEALAIPEILYASPYILDKKGYPKFCITALIYILSNGSKDYVEHAAKEYNAHYVGCRIGFGDYDVHYLVCTRHSKGNALEIANAIAESHLFVGAEPVIMGPYHGHGFSSEGPININ